MATYSFKSVRATFTGPGVGAFSLGSDAGIAPEGISVDMVEEKDKMDTGAGGQIMHSLNASESGRLTVRLLKTSPANALLNAAYNFQRLNPASWGQNVIRAADTARGDVISATEMAFVKQTPITYAKDANMNEWVFQGRIYELLGSGVSAIIPSQ